MFTRTKIICTIGPATYELSTMQKMYAAGMNVVRINMSHASHDEALNVINNVKLINNIVNKLITYVKPAIATTPTN